MAFLRAINVAGHATVRMADLTRAFEAAGCGGVETYFQSGNVLFDAPDGTPCAHDDAIRLALRNDLGLDTTVLFRSPVELEAAVGAAAFGSVADGPDIKLYVSFLHDRPAAPPALPLASPRDGLEVVGMRRLDVFVVSRRVRGRFGFPNNLVEREFGVAATTRNLNTLRKVLEKAARPRHVEWNSALP